VLVLISLYVRLRLQETPMFTELKARRAVVQNFLKVTFTGENLRRVLLAAAVSFGQAVAWYTATFWALFFLQTAQKLDLITTYKVLLPGLLVAPVLHIVMGWLSDSIGRKPIVLTGFVLAIVGFYHSIRCSGGSRRRTICSTGRPLTLMGLMLIAAMVWGPLPALLAEYFPTQVRYTSLGRRPERGQWLGRWTGPVRDDVDPDCDRKLDGGAGLSDRLAAPGVDRRSPVLARDGAPPLVGAARGGDGDRRRGIIRIPGRRCDWPVQRVLAPAGRYPLARGGGR
jgi:hypothetical protein